MAALVDEDTVEPIWRDGVPCDPRVSPGTALSIDGKPLDLNFERAKREWLEKQDRRSYGPIPTAPLNL